MTEENNFHNIDDRYILLSKAFVNTSGLSREAFIKRAFKTVFSFIPEAQKGSYFELRDDIYVAVCSQGYDETAMSQLKFSKEEAFVEYVIPDTMEMTVHEAIIKKRNLADYDDDTLDLLDTLGTSGDYITLYAPIKIDQVLIGMICLDNFNGTRYSEGSKAMLKLYAQLISNFYAMKLTQERSKNRYEDVISALVSAIEIKDHYTKGHTTRVLEYSTQLAICCKLDADVIEDIETAALLHDIGKIGVDSQILNKPGKLTAEEYSKIKEHPRYTKEILEKIDGFERIVNFAYLHHEYYNGHGYPLGLKGEEIPLGAQIIQICDAFDAMTSERSYRQAFSKDKALKIIQEEKGQQFHPLLVDYMVQIHK